MLKGGRENVAFVFSRPQPGGGIKRLVVRLAAPGGENDFPGGCADAGGDTRSGVFQGLLGPLAQSV